MSSNPFSRGGAHAHFVDHVIASNSWQARESALQLYTKIVSNILNHPDEAKYRRMNAAKVMQKLGAGFIGLAEMLKAVGFTVEGESLILPQSASLPLLCASLCAWRDRESRFAEARAEADRVRAENLASIAAEKASSDARKAQIKARAEAARRETNDRIVRSSVGQALTFGATVGTVPPPPPPQKGG